MRCKLFQLNVLVSSFNVSFTEILRKAQAVQGMLAFTIFITHGLACYVAIDITWNEYMSKRIQNYNSFWEYVTRTLLVFATCKLKWNFLNICQLISFLLIKFYLLSPFPIWSFSLACLEHFVYPRSAWHFPHWFRHASTGIQQVELRKHSWSRKILSLRLQLS